MQNKIDNSASSNDKPIPGLRPIKPLPGEKPHCIDPSHAPPMHMVIPQGYEYVHMCPSCGYTAVLRPPQISL